MTWTTSTAEAQGLIHQQSSKPGTEQIPRDGDGFTPALRIALYTSAILKGRSHVLDVKQLVDVLYLLGLTANLVKDQLDLRNDAGLFLYNLDLVSLEHVRDFIDTDFPACLQPDSCKGNSSVARSWQYSGHRV